MEDKAFCNDFSLSDGVCAVSRREAGVTLIELVVAIVLIELAFLAIANSTRTSFYHFKRSLRETYATELAIEKMEEISAKDPETISEDGEKESITRRGVKFTRSVNVAVQNNNSRLVTVSVFGEQLDLGGKCILSNTFPIREKPSQ